jgi:hypothetical protein
MKKIKTALVSLSILLGSSIAHSQTINCSDFTLLGYGPDPFNPGNSIVHIQFAADSMDFINYPYVSFVKDCNGDTIATGNMNFFGQMGQSVQPYPVTGDITNACLPITIEFIYGNNNFETDTCMFTLNSLATAMTCNDFTPIDIQVDQSNTIINISMQGSSNTYIANSQISTVTDCSGDTIATGFLGSFGQIGLSTQGYPVTQIGNTVCYPITIEFIYTNTNFDTDTCLLTLNSTTNITESQIFENEYMIFPNPAVNEISINSKHNQTENNYQFFDYKGKLISAGRLNSGSTTIDISGFSNGIYLLKINNNSGETYKIVKE